MSAYTPLAAAVARQLGTDASVTAQPGGSAQRKRLTDIDALAHHPDTPATTRSAGSRADEPVRQDQHQPCNARHTRSGVKGRSLMATPMRLRFSSVTSNPESSMA